jgi:hypothetical protein
MSWKELETMDAELTTWAMAHPTRMFIFDSQFTTRLVNAVSAAREEWATNGFIDLTSWLPCLALDQKCRDPRDLVFGLFGCAGTIFPENFVDYRKPVRHVFRDATKLVIETTRSLEIINNPTKHFRADGLNALHLPTWSPHWGKHHILGIQHNYGESDSRRSASMFREHLPIFVSDPNALIVRGGVTDTVMAKVGGTPRLLPDVQITGSKIRDICIQVWEYIGHHYQKHDRSEPLSADHFDFVRDIVNTVCCHIDTTRPPLDITDIPLELAYKEIAKGAVATTLGTMQGAWNHACITQGRCAGRAIVVLASGGLALVWDHAVQVGDQVAILHGLDVPCIIRRAGGESEWTFRGDAFVKGLMRGEGVTWEHDAADSFTLV